MENFVYEQNVFRFSARLKTEDDPAARKLVGKLLLDEENKFAATVERLDRTDGQIADCKSHISLQYALIERLKGDGHDIKPAERLLGNMMELHDLYVSYREVLLDGLDRRAL